MNSQTSLVAKQVRLQQWAEQIRDCQNRPHGVDVADWCRQQGLTKANYYYRLRRVREACLDVMQKDSPVFVELPFLPNHPEPCKQPAPSGGWVASIHGRDGLTVDVSNQVSPELLEALIGALSHVK